MFKNIANSIIATSITGIVGDLNTKIININIIAIDVIFTLLKSVSAISTKSFISGASPDKIALLSYFLIMLFITK